MSDLATTFLELAGMASLAIAGFMVSVALGFAVLGAALMVVGIFGARQ